MSFIRRIFAPDIPDDPYAGDQQQRIQSIDHALGDMRARSDTAMRRGDMTTEQLFGDEIDRTQRSIRDQAAGTRRGVQRGAMIRGGDTSGGLAASLLGIDQQTNRQAGNVQTQFTGLASRERSGERRRADALLQNVMGTEQNMLQRADELGRQERMLELQQGQATRQGIFDVVGGLFNTGSTIASSVLGAGE